MKTSTLGTAVITGYVLGRFHKTKWALGLAAIAGGKRLAGGRQDGAAGPAARLAESAGLGQLTGDLSGRLIEAGKTAAVTAASRKIDAVTGSLHDRSASLRGAAPPHADPADAPDPEDADAPDPEGSAAPSPEGSAADGAEPDRERGSRPRARRPARQGAGRPAGTGGERRPARGDSDSKAASRPARRRPADSTARKRPASARERGGSQ